MMHSATGTKEIPVKLMVSKAEAKESEVLRKIRVCLYRRTKDAIHTKKKTPQTNKSTHVYLLKPL